MNTNYEFSISIVIPTLNRPKKLEQLIDSLVNVNWKETELLIVDDSLDSHEIQLRENRDCTIHYIHRGQKLGVSSARNLGAQCAKGKYLIFLDDDDKVTANWFEDFYATVAQDYDLVFCNMKRIDLKNLNGVLVKPSDHRFGANGNNIVIPGAFMLKRALFESLDGYDEKILYAENTELFYRIELLNNKRYFIDKANLIYCPSEDGGSKNLKNMIDSNKIILEKHMDWLPENHKHVFNQIIGVNYMRFGESKKASMYFFKAIQAKPFRFGTYCRLLISLSPYLSKIFYKKDLEKN